MPEEYNPRLRVWICESPRMVIIASTGAGALQMAKEELSFTETDIAPINLKEVKLDMPKVARLGW